MPISGMHLIGAAGFETQDAIECSANVGGGSVQSAIAHFDGYAYRANPTMGTQYVEVKDNLHIGKVNADASSAWVRGYANPNGAFSGETDVLIAYTTVSFSAISYEIAVVTIDASLVVRLYYVDATGARVQITGTTTLPANLWARIELKLGSVDTGGSSTVELRIEDTVVATASSLSVQTPANRGTFSKARFGAMSGTTADIVWDDICLRDDQYPGVGHIIALRPASLTGGPASWAAVGGTNITAVQDAPEDGDTSYVWTGTIGDEIDWGCDSVPVKYLITATWAASLGVSRSESGTPRYRPLMRQGATYYGTGTNLNQTTSYDAFGSVAIGGITTPAMTTSWLNTLELVGKRDIGAGNVRVTSMFLMVEFPVVGILAAGMVTGSSAVLPGGGYEQRSSTLMQGQAVVLPSGGATPPTAGEMDAASVVLAQAQKTHAALATITAHSAGLPSAKVTYAAASKLGTPSVLMAAVSPPAFPTAPLQSGQRLRVDVYNAAGTIQGSGPVTLVDSSDYTLALDKIGSFRFSFSALDLKALLITQGGLIRLYREGEGWVFWGVVDKAEYSPAADSSVKLVITGGSIGRQLVWANMLLATQIASGVAANDVVDLILGYASGWTRASSIGTDHPAWLGHGFDGISVWDALVKTATLFGYHLRENPLARTVDLGKFGTNPNSIVFTNVFGDLPSASQLNTKQFLIGDMRITDDSTNVWPTLIPIGSGTGAAAVTLRWATRPTQLCANPSFETNTTGWTGLATSSVAIHTNVTLDTVGNAAAASPDYAAHGIAVGRFIASGSGTFGGSYAATISGATAGRQESATGYVYADGSIAGKTALIQIQGTGGGTGTETSPGTSFVLAAGWNFVYDSYALTANDRTGVVAKFQIQSGTAANVMDLDAVVMQETTLALIDLHPRTTYNSGVRLDYLVNETALAAYGHRTKPIVAKDVILNPPASLAMWQGVSNQLYDLAMTYGRRTWPGQSLYECTVLGLPHLDGSGNPLFSPGDVVQLVYNGVTVDAETNTARAWRSVNANVYILGFTRTFAGDGSSTWKFSLGTADKMVLTSEEKIAELSANLTALTQAPALTPNGWSIGVDVVPVNAANPFKINTPLGINILAVNRVTVRFTPIYVSGAGNLYVQANGGAIPGSPFTAFGSEYVVDITNMYKDSNGMPYGVAAGVVFGCTSTLVIALGTPSVEVYATQSNTHPVL